MITLVVLTMLDRTSINLYPNRPVCGRGGKGGKSLGLARVWLYLIIHGSTMWALDDPVIKFGHDHHCLNVHYHMR